MDLDRQADWTMAKVFERREDRRVGSEPAALVGFVNGDGKGLDVSQEEAFGFRERSGRGCE